MSALFNLLALTEDERFHYEDEVHVYAGSIGLHVMPAVFTPFHAGAAAVRRHLEGDLAGRPLGERTFEVWRDAVQRVRDRHYGHAVVGARNQSAEFAPAFQRFADGTGRLLDHQLARMYGHNFANSQFPLGYWVEDAGPSASYAGMQHSFLGVYARLTEASPLGRDDVMRDAIARSYRFFNHTVAPEPEAHGGRRLGGFAMHHRISLAFNNEGGWGAGAILNDLDEVAPWHREHLWPEWAANDGAKFRQRIDDLLGKTRDALRAGSPSPSRHDQQRVDYGRPQDWPVGDLARLPVERGELTFRLSREPGPEDPDDGSAALLSVRRGDVFAVAFDWPNASTYGPGTNYGRYRCHMRLRVPEYNTGGPWIDVPHRRITPFGTGGLSSVWTADFGTSLASTNLSPEVNHGVLAVFRGPRQGFDVGCPRDDCVDDCDEEVEHFFYPELRRSYVGRDGWDEDTDTLTSEGVLPAPEWEDPDVASPPLWGIQQTRRTTVAPAGVSFEVELLNTDDARTYAPDELWENLPFLTSPDPHVRNHKGRPVWFVDGDGETLADADAVMERFGVVDGDGRGVEVVLELPARVVIEPTVLRDLSGGTAAIQWGRARIAIPMGGDAALEPGEETVLRYQIVPWLPD